MKKILCIILAFAMLLTVIPLSAFASDTDPAESTDLIEEEGLSEEMKEYIADQYAGQPDEYTGDGDEEEGLKLLDVLLFPVLLPIGAVSALFEGVGYLFSGGILMSFFSLCNIAVIFDGISEKLNNKGV